MNPQQEPVRFGVVGLGHIACKAVLPAFAKSARAAAVSAISGSGGRKAEEAGFRFSHVYPYEELEQAIARERLEAVYLAVPNHLHRPLAIRAFQAGAHVLTEKPLGVSVADGEAMIAAARAANRKLMVGLRLQFGQAHRAAMSMAHGGALGEVRSFHSVFTVQVHPGNVRTKKAAGGGPLLDLGVYCINASRRLFQAEPDEVFGTAATNHSDERFAEIPEMFSAVLHFPGERLATFTCSFGSTRVMTYDVVGTEGAVHLDPAYDYASDIHFLAKIKGERKEDLFPKQDQFAAQIDHFAECIRLNREPLTDGEDGLADLRVIEALERSAAQGKTLSLRDFTETA